MDFKEVKDSGKRQGFNSGSVRDTDEGKGQPHLIAGEALQDTYTFLEQNTYNDKEEKLNPLKYIEKKLLCYSIISEDREQRIYLIYESIDLTIAYLSQLENNSYSGAMRRFAQHYSNGAKKYAKNNWRKGQPISRYYDSAMRHLWACIDGKIDEDHPAALLWNLIAIIQTKIDIEIGLLHRELNDFPFTIKEVFEEDRPFIDKG